MGSDKTQKYEWDSLVRVNRTADAISDFEVDEGHIFYLKTMPKIIQIAHKFSQFQFVRSKNHFERTKIPDRNLISDRIDFDLQRLALTYSRRENSILRREDRR